jgi:hypothetical protein
MVPRKGLDRHRCESPDLDGSGAGASRRMAKWTPKRYGFGDVISFRDGADAKWHSQISLEHGPTETVL